jgi:GT2 family glycosyltransferase
VAADEPVPSLSAIVPTSRGGRDLEQCLASLAAQRYPSLDVILVDNASGDPSLAALDEEGRVRLIRNDENLGFVEACNQGLEAARGELVLFLNDDTIVAPGALRALVGALADHPGWAACQAKLLLMDDPTRLDTAGSFLTATGFLVHRGWREPEQRFQDPDEIFAAKGAALLARRRAVEGVGGFDRDFFAYLEETDLCWRLWLAGWAVGFAADARVLHKLGATASTLPSDFVQFHSFKNRVCMLLKNLGSARLVWMMPYHVGLCLALAAWYPLRGHASLGVAVLRALAWNVRHLRRTLGKRRAIQARRSISDRELMPQITRRTPLRTLASYAGAAAPQKPGSAETRGA